MNRELRTRDSTPLIFFFTLVLVVWIKLQLDPWIKEGTFKSVVDHLTTGIIVASLLALTYEYALSKRREETFQRQVDTFRQLFDEHREKVFNSLRAYMLLSPEEVFGLLKDIASQTDETPTLYRPARQQGNEYTFADSVKYFDTLIDVRRKEIIDVLRAWINPSSHPNLKFLASDFIGMYRLKELATDLRQLAFEKLLVWDGVRDQKQRGWILNYIWAFSRCEDKMYESLGRMLLVTQDDWIQKWILFVPRQMPGPEFAEMITAYLSRGDAITVGNLKEVVDTLAALENTGFCDAREVFKKFGSLFYQDDLPNHIDQTWRSYGLDPRPITELIARQPPVAPRERRRSPRHAFDASLKIDWDSATIHGKVRDISAEGIFIELPEPLAVGTRFRSLLSLEPPLALDCVVRRVKPALGMGLGFTLSQEEHRPRLTGLLDTLPRK